jgi:nickel/cobalt transporter (NicO) family protein
MLCLLLLPILGHACVACLEEDPFARDIAPTPSEMSFTEKATARMIEVQRDLHRKLIQTLHDLRNAPSAHSVMMLALLGFFYGIFHAAGPGHGKAVITAYLLTQPTDLARGIRLSVAAALVQGLSAITLVLVFVGLLGWMISDTLGQIRQLELASFLLLALVGAWLCLRALRAMWRLWRQASPVMDPRAVVTTKGAALSGMHFTPLLANGPGIPAVQETGSSRMRGSTHERCGCGTAHHVDMSDQQGTWLATVLAVGIRPCTGAVVVMVMASLLGFWLAGVAAVLAMSVGTAITVSLFAILAVQARDWTRRRFRHRPYRGLRYAGAMAGFAGGALILMVGWILFLGAYGLDPAPPPIGL